MIARDRSIGIRGAALAETAVVLSFLLLLLFGTMQLAVAGYFQMQLDAAAFEYAHTYALGATDPAALAQVAQLFPNVPTSGIAFSASSPPITDQPVNFTPGGQTTNRYGGASIMRPQRLNAQATLNVGGFGFLSANPIPFSAAAVEGRDMISNHDDDAQGAGYDSSTVYKTQVNPITQDDQNVPPYYFNFGFLFHCSDNPGWGATCSNQSLEALGLAEYLKDGNVAVDGNYDVADSGVTAGQTFQAMAFHQRIYAQIAAVLLVNPTKPAFSGSSSSFWSETSGITVPSQTASFKLIYSWDVRSAAGKGNGLGRQNPLSPLSGCCD
ncbi:MAG: TadE/TadG family type IV pilus assembly protein [Candidatus Baltobacteraceae bacterium]